MARRVTNCLVSLSLNFEIPRHLIRRYAQLPFLFKGKSLISVETTCMASHTLKINFIACLPNKLIRDAKHRREVAPVSTFGFSINPTEIENV